MRIVALAALITVAFAGCRLLPTSPPAPMENVRAAGPAVSPPEWRPGDRWVYRLNGAAADTRVVDVIEQRQVGGLAYYVVKTPDSDLVNYWTLELAWAFAAGTRDAKVEARVDQPVPWFNWPLQVGRRWTYKGVYEDRSGKRETNDTFMVVGTEIVEVPAGRFEAVKIVREGQALDSDQYWYAPEVRSYVKWILKRGDKRLEEDLVEYKPVDRLIPDRARVSPRPR